MRVADFLQDFDKLRTGYVTEERFRQGLKGICPDLTANELKSLVQQYATRSGPTPVAWRQFEGDVESSFTTGGLEKYPTA